MSPDERRPPITPQLAVRVAVLGGIALALFAIIFFRLWFLQVLSGDDYVSEAANNRVRKIRIEAPRGNIVDRNGTVLVETREAPVVQIEPSALPEAELAVAEAYRKALSAAERDRLAAGDRLREIDRTRRVEGRRFSADERRERRQLARAARRARPVSIPAIPPSESEMLDLFRRLGKVLDLSPRAIHVRVVRSIADAPYANVTVQTDVDKDAYDFLVERRDDFPGVRTETVFLRDYPHDTLGAHLFGTLREISPEELETKGARELDLEQGDRVGKDGIEETYDEHLRGTPGYDKYRVNALNDKDERYPVTRREPRQGNRLKLTLDLDLQRSADRAMRFAIDAARANGNPADAGGFVAMHPKSGEVYALGSYPSFDANIFAKPLSQSTYEGLIDPEQGAPLFNRAISATYPTGSVFKPITAVATLAEGILTPERNIFDDGVFKLGPQEFKNARDAKFGSIALARALQVSSDVFFYTLGAEANAQGPIIQRWAKRLGLGRSTGIDLPGEFAGLVPDRKWRDGEHAKYLRCVDRADLEPGTFAALKECGGVERPWTAGDNVNLAVGQGDLQATPLQMAVAYSTIANGGDVPRPHLGLKVEDGVGRPILDLERSRVRRAPMDPTWRDAIMEGLRRAAMEPSGTSYDVFRGLAARGVTVYGKTGTVERQPNPDQSWYAAYVPGAKPVVVVVTVEKGGFGAESAAPAACRIIAEWLSQPESDCQVGSSQTR